MSRITGSSSVAKRLSYQYIAYDKQGKLVRGSVKAPNEIAAERLLVARGYSSVKLEIAQSAFSLEGALPSLFKINKRDISIFSRQLATLLKSGISLMPALEILRGNMASSRAFKKIVGTIINDLHAGDSFSQAIVRHPEAFDEVYCKTMAVSEQSGNLENVLNRLAEYHEKHGEVTKKIKGALAYPLGVLGLGVVVVIVLMVMVMPNLIDLFSSVGTELPLPTRVLINITKFVNTYKYTLLIITFLSGVLFVLAMKHPTGRRWFDRIQISVPLIGPNILMGELSRFCRTTSMLLNSGVRLQDIMEMMPQSVSNKVIRDALNQVKEGLILGYGLSGPMTKIRIFPPLLVQMVIVGEESNTLGFTMGVVADFYETTSSEKTAALVGLIGPLSTVIVASMVGFIALSIVMPIYTITGAFG